MANRELTAGEYAAELDCPRCGQTVFANVALEAVLTVPSAGDATVRAKVRTRPVPHKCAQDRLPFEAEA